MMYVHKNHNLPLESNEETTEVGGSGDTFVGEKEVGAAAVSDKGGGGSPPVAEGNNVGKGEGNGGRGNAPPAKPPSAPRNIPNPPVTAALPFSPLRKPIIQCNLIMGNQ